MTYINPLYFILLILFVVQLIIGIYVYQSAKNHGMNKWLWTIIAIFVPNLMGLVLFFFARSQLKQKGICTNCSQSIKPEYLFCPYCGDDRKQHCSSCAEVVQKSWSYCPHCANSLRGANHA
ncbi:hypothetical protein EJF36_01240 [Bacillus sp. HMF5848]|uniref:double zinc ribbon domain-containing protein n=1 Tax=Bacillus sp. HMF5848 TaxID=2495421 RepID=UPI000F78F8C0|nr:zinc ribbon domain-containing protein [Bacillus sp. HMF5848]RSK25645.1 hypothetical protein EJF36_01240 [Bacillus sp. HMF5848]